MGTKKIVFFSSLPTLSASGVFAHPGHGQEGTTGALLHALEPVHALPWIVLLGGVSLGFWLFRRLKTSRR